jgi:hypothetical protein
MAEFFVPGKEFLLWLSFEVQVAFNSTGIDGISQSWGGNFFMVNSDKSKLFNLKENGEIVVFWSGI